MVITEIHYNPEGPDEESFKSAWQEAACPSKEEEEEPGLSQSPKKVILVTSSEPAEGKTSFCIALGRTAAQDGLRFVQRSN